MKKQKESLTCLKCHWSITDKKNKQGGDTWRGGKGQSDGVSGKWDEEKRRGRQMLYKSKGQKYQEAWPDKLGG